jgi:hypothetical protein
MCFGEGARRHTHRPIAVVESYRYYLCFSSSMIGAIMWRFHLARSPAQLATSQSVSVDPETSGPRVPQGLAPAGARTVAAKYDAAATSPGPRNLNPRNFQPRRQRGSSELERLPAPQTSRRTLDSECGGPGGPLQATPGCVASEVTRQTTAQQPARPESLRRLLPG